VARLSLRIGASVRRKPQTRSAIPAARSQSDQHPSVGVLLLSQYVEAGYGLELLQESAEGVGYLLKDRVSDVKEFADAVCRGRRGRIRARSGGRLMSRRPEPAWRPNRRADAARARGTRADGRGRSNQAIAERLVVTPRAVEKHVTSIFAKLKLTESAEDHRRVLAVLTYLNA
jgi:DNA-binding NarL/FixJ family response regulator